MKEIELSRLATGVPIIELSLGVKEALRTFEEYGIYDFLVVVKDNKPAGIVYKFDLINAQQRPNLIVGELVHPVMKLKNVVIKSDELVYLLDFFNFSKSPLLLIDKKRFLYGCFVLPCSTSSYKSV